VSYPDMLEVLFADRAWAASVSQVFAALAA
jgi:hypothetical protein